MNLGIDLQLVGLEVERLAGTGFGATTVKLTQTPRAKKVIEYSMQESRNLNHDYIGSEHVLLGLLHDPEGIAARVLVGFGVTPGQIRLETFDGDTACRGPRRCLFAGRFGSSNPDATETDKDQLEKYVNDNSHGDTRPPNSTISWRGNC